MDADKNMFDSIVVRTAAFVDDHRLLGQGDTVVVAISGGGDSVALARILVELAKDPARKYRIYLAHLNHQLRPESDEDADFVRDLARQLGVTAVVYCADVGARAQRYGVSTELAGREARYAMLRRVVRLTGASAVALGHQADDNVETVLHRILRGTALRGLAGIRPSRVLQGTQARIVRPVLSLRREDLCAYLDRLGQPFRHDASNETADFTRNRLRNELLPLLRRQFNPRVDEALLRLATSAAEAGAWLQSQADAELKRTLLDVRGTECRLSAGTLAALPKALRGEVFRVALARLGASLREIGREEYERLGRLAMEHGPAGPMNFPGGLSAEVRDGVLCLRRETVRGDAAKSWSMEVPVQGAVELPNGARLELDSPPCGHGDASACLEGKPSNVEYMDLDAVAPPLIARTCRRGDRFRPLGAPGGKQVGDFFTDARIPRERRQAAWLLLDRCGPIWLAGHRLDDRVRVRDHTRRLLRLRWVWAGRSP